MALVELRIRDRKFELECPEEQLERMTELSSGLNDRIDHMSKRFNNAPDNLLIAITALTIEDELKSARTEFERLQFEFYQYKNRNNIEEVVNNVVGGVTSRMRSLTNYINNLAYKVENL